MTTIEKMARAMWATNLAPGLDYCAWEDANPTARRFIMDQARAALTAIMDPSPAMIDRFVSRALCVSIHGEGGWSEYARGQWQTMIQAGLDEVPE